jgi:hypothetical protein
MRRIQRLCFMSLALALLLAAPAWSQGVCQGVDLGQGWSDSERQEFWFRSQGSRLLNYAWFLALEDVGTPELFRDNLESLGFIPARQSAANPDALPVGFTKDRPFADAAVGLTCAACHVSRRMFKGTPLIIEGAPGLADFELFMKRLEAAMEDTVMDADKFKRFADRVLPGADPTALNELKRQLDEKAKQIKTEWNAHWPAEPSGPGRVDAFGQIYNQTIAYAIKAPQNARIADAPVSFPHLWNTPQHDVVQWNGAASNGLVGLGPLFRNVGEALGVFGEITVARTKTPKYDSSLRLANIRRLEDIVKTLRPPAWPTRCAPIDPVKADEGRVIYERLCTECHSNLPRTDLTTRFKAKMKRVDKVGTDPAMVRNYASRFAETRVSTGILQGQYKTFFFFSKFGESAKGVELLTNLIIGGVIGGGVERIAGLPDAAQQELESRARQVRESIQQSRLKYKARPLAGIWATAPYLHNGSVPNLRELLKPANERVSTFYVGNSEIDFVNIGLSTDSSPGSVLLNTAIPGNVKSGHTGPEYGTTLPQSEKEALLEYLKIVGESSHTP